MGNSSSHTVTVYNYMTSTDIVGAFAYDYDDSVHLVYSDDCWDINKNGDSCSLKCNESKCDIEICKTWSRYDGDCTSATWSNNMDEDYLLVFDSYSKVVSDTKPNEDSFWLQNQNAFDVEISLDVTPYGLPASAAGDDRDSFELYDYSFHEFEPVVTFGYVDVTFVIPDYNNKSFTFTGVEVTTDCGYYFEYNTSKGTATLEAFTAAECSCIGIS